MRTDTILLWHGTGDVHGIAETGKLSMNPPWQQYSEGELQSHGGIYLSEKLRDALYYAHTASIELANEPGIVLVEARPGDLVVDEDILAWVSQEGLGLPEGATIDEQIQAISHATTKYGGIDCPLRKMAAKLGKANGPTNAIQAWLETYGDWLSAKPSERLEKSKALNIHAKQITEQFPRSLAISHPGVHGVSCRILSDIGIEGPNRIVFAAELGTFYERTGRQEFETVLGKTPKGFTQTLVDIMPSVLENDLRIDADTAIPGI